MLVAKAWTPVKVIADTGDLPLSTCAIAAVGTLPRAMEVVLRDCEAFGPSSDENRQ